MFFSIEELVRQAENYPSVAELMIAVEMDMSGRPREQIIAIMEKNLSVMEQSIAEGNEGVTSVTGITG
ncbi:L-serine ammonia-lyase, iron-sulfur-dependent, subunit alpha, partial [Vibrio parahaemolyticus]|nr:L-serine ammonia-lyase, iron-sulfur-dependent, subunit alpha [Vibrio parahaemolyticus]